MSHFSRQLNKDFEALYSISVQEIFSGQEFNGKMRKTLTKANFH